MAETDEPDLEFWQILHKWDTSGSPLFEQTEQIGFWTEQDAAEYLAAKLNTDTLTASISKTSEPQITKSVISHTEYLFRENFDNKLYQRDVTDRLRKADRKKSGWEDTAEEERWSRDFEWAWVWDLKLSSETPQGGRSWSGLGRVYLDDLNADHLCCLREGSVPDNVRRRLSYEIPRAMYKQHIAPRMKAAREKADIRRLVV